MGTLFQDVGVHFLKSHFSVLWTPQQKSHSPRSYCNSGGRSVRGGYLRTRANKTRTAFTNRYQTLGERRTVPVTLEVSVRCSQPWGNYTVSRFKSASTSSTQETFSCMLSASVMLTQKADLCASLSHRESVGDVLQTMCGRWPHHPVYQTMTPKPGMNSILTFYKLFNKTDILSLKLRKLTC